jgi:hypothetical protein
VNPISPEGHYIEQLSASMQINLSTDEMKFVSVLFRPQSDKNITQLEKKLPKIFKHMDMEEQIFT